MRFDEQVFTHDAPPGCCQVALDRFGRPVSGADYRAGGRVFTCAQPARWHYVIRPKGFDPKKHMTLTGQTCHAHRADPELLPDDAVERCLIE